MRRKDREVTDKKEIREILDSAKVLRLSLFHDTYPYIVPLSYGYEFDCERLVFYMHSAHEGLKLDIIRKNQNAAIELDCSYSLKEGITPCSWGAYFKSIIARGKAEIIEDKKEKIHALELLMKTQTGKNFSFTPKMIECISAIKFTCTDYSVKANFPKKEEE